MNLPIEISPNPLVTTTIELRYNSNIKANELLPLVYREFMTDFPSLELSNIPIDIKKAEKKFRYQPDYILSNSNFRISFSDQVLTFENVSEYPLWNNYFSFVSESIKKFFKLNHVNYIERIGVRYASILEKVTDAFEALTTVPKLEINGYDQKFDHYRTFLYVDSVKLFLQIFNQADLRKNNIAKRGVYIDIDASTNGKFEPNNTVLTKIDKLHLEQKKLFFKLLNPNYLSSLNPRY